MRRRERELRQLAQRAGMELLELRIGGSGHYKARLRDRDGAVRVAVFSASPSDRLRSDKNALRQMHKQAERGGNVADH